MTTFYIKAKTDHINTLLSEKAAVKIGIDKKTAQMIHGKESLVVLVENTKNGLIGRKVKPDSCGVEEKARYWLKCTREQSEAEKMAIAKAKKTKK